MKHTADRSRDAAATQAADGKAAAGSAEQLTALLTDRRLVRVSDKKLVYSHIVGKATSFLSDCCDAVTCPAGAPYA